MTSYYTGRIPRASALTVSASRAAPGAAPDAAPLVAVMSDFRIVAEVEARAESEVEAPPQPQLQPPLRAAEEPPVRAEGDAYMTPPWVTKLLLKHVGPIKGKVLEPAAGTGAMASVLRWAGLDVETADITEGQNFFDRTEPVDNVITNPPYYSRLAEKFAWHALGLVRPGGLVALLVRTGFLHGKRRFAGLFAQHRPDCVIVVSERIIFFHRDGTPIKGQAHDHSWVCWRKPKPGQTSQPLPALIWGGTKAQAE